MSAGKPAIRAQDGCGTWVLRGRKDKDPLLSTHYLPPTPRSNFQTWRSRELFDIRLSRHKEMETFLLSISSSP